MKLIVYQGKIGVVSENEGEVTKLAGLVSALGLGVHMKHTHGIAGVVAQRNDEKKNEQ